MKKTLLLNLIVVLVITNALVLSSAMAEGAPADQDDALAQNIKNAQSKVVTTVSTFTGTVVVKTDDQSVAVTPGEAVETLKGVMEMKPISWKDVATYERMLINQEAPDPKKFQFTRWVLENVQTRRINRVLIELKARLKKQYQESHGGKTPMDDVLTTYLPGKNPQERLEQLGRIIDQVAVEELGLDLTGPLTHEMWRMKMVTSTSLLRDVDIKKLCELAGLLLPSIQEKAEAAQTPITKDPELPETSGSS